MYENSGRTLKGFAVCLFLLELCASISGAIILWTNGLGFAVLIGGCLISYFSNLFIFAFGELVENSQRQNELLVQIYEEQKAMNKHLANPQKPPVLEAVNNKTEVSKNVSDYLPEL